MQATKTRSARRIDALAQGEPLERKKKVDKADRYERSTRSHGAPRGERGAEGTASLLSVQAAARRARMQDRLTLILIGPPGSGKGTQAKLLAKRYGIPHISTGDLLRDPKIQKTEVGKKAKAIMDKGKLVPDSIMMQIVEQRLAKKDCARGFILDGFPRTLRQAKALDALLEKQGRTLAHVLFVDVPDDECVRRVLGRNAEAAAKGEKVRADDNEATARVRLATYHEQTEDALAYYGEREVVRHVDGQRDIKTITAELKRVVGRVAK